MNHDKQGEVAQPQIRVSRRRDNEAPTPESAARHAFAAWVQIPDGYAIRLLGPLEVPICEDFEKYSA